MEKPLLYVEPEIFHRHDPDASAVPVLVDVSRSGRLYPIDFRSPVPFTALHDNVSMYVDEIWKDAPRYGAPLQERKLTVAEINSRLDRYWRPYHREFRAIAERMHAAGGFYYNLSCHCMSAVGAPTHADAGKERMDFCIGNLKGTTSTTEFIELSPRQSRRAPRTGTHRAIIRARSGNCPSTQWRVPFLLRKPAAFLSAI